MPTVYDYVMSVWLRVAESQLASEFEEDLLEHLLESGFQINELKMIEQDDPAEVEVSLRIQLTLTQSQMDGDEPASEAVAEFDEELRTCLSAKYDVTYLEVMDDAPTSFLLGSHDDA